MTKPLRKVEKVLAPLDQADPLARRLLPVIRRMVEREAQKLKVPAPRVQVKQPHAVLMAACRKVAEATDQLEQAKFSGAAEIPARRVLEKAAHSLRRVMQKHGRMP